jgi:hypothetical protein
VHDPAEVDAVLEARYGHLNLARNTSEAQKERARVMLRSLEGVIRSVNPYVHDIMLAAEIFEEEAPTQARFMIDADRAPTTATTRQYGDFACEDLGRKRTHSYTART